MIIHIFAQIITEKSSIEKRHEILRQLDVNVPVLYLDVRTITIGGKNLIFVSIT